MLKKARARAALGPDHVDRNKGKQKLSVSEILLHFFESPTLNCQITINSENRESAIAGQSPFLTRVPA